MRWLIVALLCVWGVLTAVGYLVVIPDQTRDRDVILTYWKIAAEGSQPKVSDAVAAFLSEHSTKAATAAELTRLQGADQDDALARFRAYCQKAGNPAANAPVLVWSTDDNPARRVQCQLFREWHLRTYGEPVDILPDPTNRDITKTIVQCVAGAGPDIIEAYGPAELSQMVSAGVALDVTDEAKKQGFGADTVFSAAVSSIAIDPDGPVSSSAGRSRSGASLLQYAYPCNVGYTVIFFHKDLFRQAGIEPPKGSWTMPQLIEASRKIMAADPSGRRVGIMGLGAWGMALYAGNTFYNADQTASLFNNEKTVAAFRAYQDLMYKDKVMPTPAEAASMASSGGANMNALAESASASALFAAKIAAMVSDGRWSYVSLAQRNRDRVIAPAVQRRLAELAALKTPEADKERDLLTTGLKSWMEDVLVPITPEQYKALAATLTPKDREKLIEVGVMHVPTMDGIPAYEAAARVAIVNRVSPRKEYGLHFLRFLASPEYNRQINYTFDSICGVPRFCIPPTGGIKGPPEALPGLEEFDSPVFVEAMEKYAFPWELSPFIGRARLGMIAGPIMEKLTNKTITPEDAAKTMEDQINAQISANLAREPDLRKEWERRTGKTFDPSRPLREQVGKPLQQSNAGARSTRRHRELRDAACLLADSSFNPQVCSVASHRLEARRAVSSLPWVQRVFERNPRNPRTCNRALEGRHSPLGNCRRRRPAAGRCRWRW